MRRVAIAVVLALPLAPAFACGVCDEDKVAATYDHAAVQRAAAHKRVVVFCDVQGHPLDAERVRRVAAATSGIDAASVRTSAAPATLSFTLDPRRRSPQSAASALQRGAPAGTRIAIVRVLGA
nr:hypothetical protein [Caldimonas sp.]